MRDPPSPKPKRRKAVASPQADQLATWEDEGGTTVPAASGPTDRTAPAAEPVPTPVPQRRR